MALSTPARCGPAAPPRDKPRFERAEHANLDRRPGAHLHPSAGRPAAPPSGPSKALPAETGRHERKA